MATFPWDGVAMEQCWRAAMSRTHLRDRYIGNALAVHGLDVLPKSMPEPNFVLDDDLLAQENEDNKK